jgi:AcrR family transcriptional regulator
VKATRKPKPRQRLDSADRRRQILEGAISFFAAHGFEGGTRDLAKQLGVTQPLIYAYFPSKDDLIREVYQSVYVGRWRAEWSDLISDRSRTLRDRLVEFYGLYTSVIYSADWLRIYLFSGLKGLQINTMWISFVEDHLIRRMCNEIRYASDLPTADRVDITPAELEAFWLFHSGIFYYGVRREVYHSPVHLPLGAFITTTVDTMLSGLPSLARRSLEEATEPA